MNTITVTLAPGSTKELLPQRMGVSTSPAQSVVAAPHQVGASHDVAGEPSKLQGAGTPNSYFGSLKNLSTKALGLAISLTKS